MQQDRVKELLSILDQEEDTEVELEHSDDVIDFIEFYNIKKGRFWVRYSILKRLYNYWSDVPVNKLTFTKRLTSHIPSIKRRHIRFYFINRSSLNITKEAYKFINQKNKLKIRVVDQKKLSEFLKENKIKPGKRYPAKYTHVYYMFIDWCEKKKIKRAPLAYKNFIGLMKQTYESRLDKQGRGYFMITRNLRRDYLSPQRIAAIERYNEEEIQPKDQD